MNCTPLQSIFLTLFQLVLLLLFCPIINIFIKKIKANFQGRKGPPILQGYYDLIKYFHKETVVSNNTSWIFLFTPAILLATTMLAALLTPAFSSHCSINLMGGIILFVYLLGLGRFFMACAATEPHSGFCSMGSSREMMLSVLIEPVLMLSLFIFVFMTGSNNLYDIISNISNHGLKIYTPYYLLAVLALLTASIAEMGRIPFDNPETHYELTMIHEGMLLEYSGKYLGIMFLSGYLKQLILISLVGNLLFPWHMTFSFTLTGILSSIGIYLLKIVLVSFLIAIIETVIAKIRLFRVRDILIASFVMSVIALVLCIQKGSNLGL